MYTKRNNQYVVTSHEICKQKLGNIHHNKLKMEFETYINISINLFVCDSIYKYLHHNYKLKMESETYIK